VRVHFAVPGRLDRLTGGSIYDARIVAGLRNAGYDVVVHELPGRFPDPDAAARLAAAQAAAAAGRDDVLVIDGLVLSAFEIGPSLRQSRTLVLCHMPVAEEVGIAAPVREALAAAEAERLRRADRIVATGEVVARSLAARGIPAERIGVVEPGTDPAPGRPTRTPGSDVVRILAVGAVTRVKGHATLVRALARLADLPWRLRIVGSTREEPETVRALRSEIARAGLGRRIRLDGERPHERVLAAYRTADLFVHPSCFESYGMALAEALAHGLPLVATRAGGVPATPAGAAALLVPPGDEAALADALRRVIGAPELWRELAEAARRHAPELPTWDEAARRFACELEAVRGARP
jgi:glycosyltransferase involved in cell wall biosynthesis